MGCVSLQDVCKEHPVVCGCIDEVLKQRDVADVVVVVDPGGECSDGGHGLTNSAQIAWVGAPWADCGDYDSSKRTTLVAGSNGHRHMLAAGWWGIQHGFSSVPLSNYNSVDFKDRLMDAASKLYQVSW